MNSNCAIAPDTSTATAPLASTSHMVSAEAGLSTSIPPPTYNNFWSTFNSISQRPIMQATQTWTQRIPSVLPLATQSTSVQNTQTIEPATIETQRTSLRIRIPLKRPYQEDTTPTSPCLTQRKKVIIQTPFIQFFLTLTPSTSVTVARRTNNNFSHHLIHQFVCRHR